MDVQISLDTRDLDRRLLLAQTSLSLDAPEAVRKEFGSTIRTIIRYTYPQSKAQGEKAVERDIRKVFTSPPDLFPNGSRVRKLDAALKASDWEKATSIIKNIEYFRRLSVADSVNPSVHNQYKNKRGAITKRGGPFVLIKNPERLKTFITEIQSHVGRAKAAWLAAAEKFGATGIGSFVKRHGSGEGTANDTMKDGTGYVEAVSHNKASESIEERAQIVDRALKNTEKYLTIRLEKTLEKMATEFGKH